MNVDSEKVVTVEAKWFRVEDELPPMTVQKTYAGGIKSIRVLCACKQESGNAFVKEGFCIKSNDDVYWSIPGTIDEVTHWTYLPRLPKEFYNE